jgi:hypothetical protein
VLATVENEVVKISNVVSETTWVGDSGASGHIINNAVGIDANIELGDGTIIKAMKREFLKVY